MKETLLTALGIVVLSASGFAESPPVALASIEPSFAVPGIIGFSNEWSSKVWVLTTNGVSATVTLDATASYDPDGDDLSFVWELDDGGEHNTFIPGDRITLELWRVEGEASVGLIASDGTQGSMRLIYIWVATPVDVAGSILEFIDEEAPSLKAQHLAETPLRAAMERLEAGDMKHGAKFMELFNKTITKRHSGWSQSAIESMLTASGIIIDAASNTLQKRPSYADTLRPRVNPSTR